MFGEDGLGGLDIWTLLVLVGIEIRYVFRKMEYYN
jgi:hypothetical protein